MKRPFLNKLGTALNTIGSLGVGYYLAKITLISQIDTTTLSPELLDDANVVRFLGCVIVLMIGLLLRIRDLRDREAFDGQLVQTASQIQHDRDVLQERVDDIEGVFDGVVARVIDEKLNEDLSDLIRETANQVYDARQVIDEHTPVDITGRPSDGGPKEGNWNEFS